MAALPVALPAAAASLAYLNARFSLSYDWALLSSFIASAVGGIFHEKRDNLNLFNFLESHAKSSRGSQPFIIYSGRTWTYLQAYETILKYGTWLKRKGVQKNEVVAMDFMNSEVFVWVWYGLWSIGAKPAFINYSLTDKPLVHTIRTSTARLILVDEEVKDKFSEEVIADLKALGDEEKKNLEIVVFNRELEAQIASSEGIREPDEARSGQKLSDMAMLIYTSGTTGLPKPAVLSWGKANLGARFVAGWLQLKKSDIIYTCMPLYHTSASILGLCATLRGGSTICLGRRFSHKTFWPEMIASKATILHYVGETCRYLLSAPPSPNDRAHNVRAAFGNGMRPDVWNKFKERFGIGMVCEFYGATEAPSGMWNRSANDFSAGAIGRNGSVASLILGPSLAVIKMDPDSDPPEPLRNSKSGLCQIAGWDEPGELLYKLDPQEISRKFQGYFNNSSATNSKILRDVKSKGDAWFRTGDILRWDKDGRWYFVDRIGDTFRWKAENVSTAEVSEVIGKHEVVKEANVYGVLVPGHDGRAGCAAVVLHDHSLPSTSDSNSTSALPPDSNSLRSLANYLNASLPRFAVPLFIRVTREMHTTGTNKHQKHVFQKDGIEVDKVEASGDLLFWLKDGTYQKFTTKDLQRIKGGEVKL